MATKRGLKHTDLAYLSGYGPEFVYRLMQGIKNPSLVSLVRLTDALVIGKIARSLPDGLEDEDRNALVNRTSREWIAVKWQLTEAATADAVAKETSRSRRGPGKARPAA